MFYGLSSGFASQQRNKNSFSFFSFFFFLFLLFLFSKVKRKKSVMLELFFNVGKNFLMLNKTRSYVIHCVMGLFVLFWWIGTDIDPVLLLFHRNWHYHLSYFYTLIKYSVFLSFICYYWSLVISQKIQVHS